MITSHDIARMSGVSRGTVDRVLNNRPNVNPKTREAVLKVAQELGYQPNYIASSLSKQRTNTIGIVVFDLRNRFFGQLVGAIEGRLRDLGYFSTIVLTNKDIKTEIDCIRHLRNRMVDGMILLPIGLSETVNALENLPTVTVGNKLGAFLHIGIDEYEAGAAAAKHIQANGYSKAIYIGPSLTNKDSENIWAQHQRYLGFTSILSTEITLMKDLESLLTEIKTNKTAVFCATDQYALDAHQVFKRNNINIGQDVGLMGFDNIDILNYVQPRIDTVSVAIEETGLAAAEAIVKLVEKKELTLQSISYEIIKGQSL
jgi:LacI family transcriptional regulator